ncbi:salt-induced outer membrane protein [Glaciecola sp. KUL10]|nr:salt-induced outer membrane protein [Glaciecola sp. KUL10]
MTNPAYANNDILKMLYEKEVKRKKRDKPFSLVGEFGLLTASGNTNTTTFKSSLTADHEMTKWSNKYFSEFIYKRNDGSGDRSGTVTAQRFLATVQLDYKLATEKDRLFIYAEYDDDRFNGFRYQAAAAAGYSTIAWKNSDGQFRYSIGPGYSFSQKYEVDESNESYFKTIKETIVRASLDYRYKMSEHARFRQFFSAEAGEQNKRSRSETSLTTNLVDSLAMKFSFVMIYNEADFNLNDNLSTETSISLVYQFF